LARRALAKSIHRHPGRAVLWARLRTLLDDFEPEAMDARRALAQTTSLFTQIPQAPGVASDVSCASIALSTPDTLDQATKRDIQRTLFKSPWLIHQLV
jgi:hypothetical protein